MTFPASYDRTTQIISALVAIGLAALGLFVIHNVFAGALSLLLVFFAYAYSPRAYVVANGVITVKRLIGDVRVTGVHGARRATAEDLSGCIRLFGSGGLFGYYGVFRTSKLGRCNWYVTNRENLVVAIGDTATLYSPDDVDGFLAAVGPASASVVEKDASAEPRTRNIIGIVAAVVGLAGLGLAAAAVLWDPGPPAYTLTSDSLTIHDRFYPVTLTPATVDASQVRIVDLAAEPEWRSTGRTNGFANSHYWSGWFRVANGKRVRLYQQPGPRKVVLLPPKGDGDPVLFQTGEPEAFIQEIRNRWR